MFQEQCLLYVQCTGDAVMNKPAGEPFHVKYVVFVGYIDGPLINMKRHTIIFSAYIRQVFSCHSQPSSSIHNLSIFCFSCSSFRMLSSFGSTTIRSFPDYSPKKPSIRDSEFVHHISTVIKQRCYEHLRRILKPYESKFRPDHIIWVLMEIKNDYKLVLNFFDWYCIRRDPSFEVCCIIIQIAVAAKDLKLAQKLFHDLLTKSNADGNISFSQFLEKLIYTYKDWGSNPLVFDIFFQVIVEIGRLDDARKIFDKILAYNVFLSVDSCNLFLSRLSKNIDGPKMLLKNFSEFSEVGIKWNTASYNIVMHSLCQSGKVREAHNLLMQMELRGCIADAISYSTIINGYCNIEELQLMLKLFDTMRQKGVKPNRFTFNSVILFLCKNGKVMDAEKILREMMCEGVFPDNVVYTTLIDGFRKIGNVGSSFRMYEEMQTLKIVPDFIAYTALICCLCQNGKVLEADNLFRAMINIGLKADEFTYTTLIDGYCKAGDIKMAFSLHNEMIQMGLVPNIVTYTALVDGLCKHGEVDTASELLHEMGEKGLVLNIYTCNSLLNGLCKSGNIAEAVKLMKDMEVAGILPDTFSYTTLMDAYCKSGEMVMAHQLLHEMLQKGIKPTVVTFNVLMNGFCVSGMLEDGQKLLNWMLDKGHCKARNMKEAWFLHKEIIEKGYNLTVESYNALIKGFLKRKKYLEARELFEQMRKKGLSADKEIYCTFVDVNYEEGNIDSTFELCNEAVERCFKDGT
ncbi:uncharacterized protein [Primulina eburnea]|uniref:uncharacterized protein isoform X3 n=1 Tax=Primulina eburnea TaxID=1245227 RepID=UPI003C6C97FD